MRGTLSRYKSIFIDGDYPSFIDKYLTTKSLTRLGRITFFCGCDYTNLFSPKCMYTRLDHSVNVAHMTWRFTHDKRETIAALLHDIGTPCFAHCIDYLMGDYTDQESSERNIADVAKFDSELMNCLAIDGINAEDLRDLSVYPVLENKSPRLCTDRLDGVLATVAIWLHIDSLSDVRAVYNDMVTYRVLEGLDKIAYDIRRVFPDLHLVGFDGLCAYISALKQITTIKIDYKEFAKATYEVISNRIKHNETLPRRIMIPVSLHRRKI